MKTIAELFEIIGQAVSENSREHDTWFVDYSGHVNSLRIQYHFTGWSSESSDLAAKLEVKLDEDGIQAAYWFIKTKLRRG
jgi:hypothetical protein